MFIKSNINKSKATAITTQRACDKQQIAVIKSNKIITAQNKKQIAHATLLKYITLLYKLNYYKHTAINNKSEIIKQQFAYYNYLKDNKLNYDLLKEQFNYNNKSSDELKVIFNSLKGNINYFKSLENKYNMSEEQFAYYKLNKMETI